MDGSHTYVPGRQPITLGPQEGRLREETGELVHTIRWDHIQVVFRLARLHCITPEMGKKILEELHEGVYSSHNGGRAFVVMVIRIDYYWPSLREDAMNLARTCDKCQKFAPVYQLPTTPLTPIVRLLPFAMWGMDILGPFPKATGQHKCNAPKLNMFHCLYFP